MLGSCTTDKCVAYNKKHPMKKSYEPVVIVEGTQMCIYCLQELAIRQKELMLEAANHIEQQETINAEMAKTLKEASEAIDVLTAKNKQLREFNCSLEYRIEIMGG